MFYRLLFAVPVVLSLAFPAAAQQVVRFETTAGDFDMVLNPTNNRFLGDYAQNMVNYVENNNYLGTWINRADTGFVLQMGGFFSNTKRPPPTIDSIRPVQTFAPVDGRPASALGLTNSVGTVALALPGDGQGGTDQNAGTSSFFVNLAKNSSLDADFTVFAAIPDMTTINKIMGLQTVDRSTDANFGVGPGNLAFAKVPVAADGLQVLIKRAFLVTDTLTTTKDIADVQSVMAQAAAGANPLSSLPISSGDASSSNLVADTALSSNVVPEPATAILAMLAAATFGGLSRRRR
jgi:cyclophilin family peptidyl-prolyl cis-trans isomerase